MQKLSLGVLEKMFRENITSKEINFILHIARYQDARGVIQGIYYKDICEALNISAQKFYDMIHSLEDKHIIRTEKNDYTDWDITICGNDFSLYTDEDYRNGTVKYLNVNHALFVNPVFLGLKAGAKLMAIDMLRIIVTSRATSDKRSYQIGVAKFYDKYKKLLGVEHRAIQNYLHDLKQLFGVFVKEAKFFFSLNSKHTQRTSRFEQQEYDEHIIKISCRRNRIREYREDNKRDILTVLSQYRRDIKEAICKGGGFNLSRIVGSSIEIMNELQPNKYRWRRELKPSLIHKIIRQELGYAE